MLQRVSLAALGGLMVHFACFYLFGTPLITDAIAEWIMARTPSRYAVAILEALGEWAKPFAATGGLAALGAMLLAAKALRRPVAVAGGVLALGAALCAGVGYGSWAGALSFWLPAGALLVGMPVAARSEGRRRFLLSAVMASGTAAVAVESFIRNGVLARKAVEPVALHPFAPPVEGGRFAPPLVRKAVTPVAEFYGMSKNTVDPVIDPAVWRLKITVDGRVVREISYAELLALPRRERYLTMRCISNTLQSNLMGTAQWSGVGLGQLIDRGTLPAGIVEAAVIGVDGHGDSYPLDYVFSERAMLALGMNGKTLNRTHGFPVRLLAPRYYGFKSVKWIGEIRFVSEPYFGTWPKLGYRKEAVIHTCSSIDRITKTADGILVGGVSFAGERGIRRVEVRVDGGSWVEAEMETPLSTYAWTRWRVLIPLMAGETIEARAQDGEGNWQASEEHPLFPGGVSGPTIRRISL